MKDFRYEVLRKRFGGWWVLLSLPAQFVCSQLFPEALFSVPYLYIASDASPSDWLDVLAVVFGGICLFGAWISDNDLRNFVGTAPRTAVLQSGLWAYSRHPNYLCESTFHWTFGLWALRSSAAPAWLVLSGAAFNSLILFVTCFLTEANFMRGPRREEYIKYCKKVRMIL